tara:strand:- start:1065 stop:1742 length:678 start_codon:yes stop_codon:yes gene_type:complete
MIHYHGTPLTPKSELLKLSGKHFCISYADARDSHFSLCYAQSIMWDNGAYTHYKQGKAPDWHGYYEWVESRLAHPHWAVVPDVIDGTDSDNFNLAKKWPHRKDCSAVVWHLHEPIEYIGKLLDLGFGKICFGSSRQYWQVGSIAWERRMDDAFNWLVKNGNLPWIHMLRGLSLCGDRWPFSSADSANVARNYKDLNICPERMARRIDSIQNPIYWNPRPQNMELF